MKSLDKNLIEIFHHWGIEKIRSTLIERDKNAHFNSAHWIEAQKMGLIKALIDNKEQEGICSLASMLYGLARGSLDLPLSASLAAHSAISMDLINHFATDEQRKKFGPILMQPNSIAAVCNSEEGTGSDLRKMKATAELKDNGMAVVNFEKPCATNASHANLFLVSVWILRPGQKNNMGVLILEKNEVQSWSLQNHLSGFRTGLTGGVKAENLEIPFQERLLRSHVENINIFKRCFDMERLFLGVMVSGILESVESEIQNIIHKKESSGFTYSDKQYLHEKLIIVYSARVKLTALVEKILFAENFDLNNFSKELSVIKILINEDAVNSIISFYEFIGHRAYMNDHFCQKLIRDFMGLRYFGGTTELQKTSLYNEMVRASQQKVSTKVA